MDKIIAELIQFRVDRGWGDHHIEPELSRALMIEAGELNELYLWNQYPQTDRLAEEVADVMIYAMYLCEKRGLDPETIIREKMVKNAVKYPALE